MKFKQLLTKSLLAAVCLLAGQSAWAAPDTWLTTLTGQVGLSDNTGNFKYGNKKVKIAAGETYVYTLTNHNNGNNAEPWKNWVVEANLGSKYFDCEAQGNKWQAGGANEPVYTPVINTSDVENWQSAYNGATVTITVSRSSDGTQFTITHTSNVLGTTDGNTDKYYGGTFTVAVGANEEWDVYLTEEYSHMNITKVRYTNASGDVTNYELKDIDLSKFDSYGSGSYADGVASIRLAQYGWAKLDLSDYFSDIDGTITNVNLKLTNNINSGGRFTLGVFGDNKSSWASKQGWQDTGNSVSVWGIMGSGKATRIYYNNTYATGVTYDAAASIEVDMDVINKKFTWIQDGTTKVDNQNFVDNAISLPKYIAAYSWVAEGTASTITNATMEIVYLETTYYTATFTNTTSGNTVSANIFSDEEMETPATNGMLEKGKTYYYTATEYGYQDYEGSFTVGGEDPAVSFAMIAKSTFTYTVYAVDANDTQLGEIARVTGYEGDTKSVSWSKYVNINGTWYSTSTNSFTQSDISETGTKNVIYSEASNIEQYVEATGSNWASTGENNAKYSSGVAYRGVNNTSKTMMTVAETGTYNIRYAWCSYNVNKDLTMGIYKNSKEDANELRSSSVTHSVNYVGTTGTGVIENVSLAANDKIIVFSSSTNGILDYVLLERASVSKTISDAGWATYCSPYPLDLANATGLTGAYIVTGGENGVLTKTPVMNGTVPANTGLLLKGNEGTVTIPVVANSSTDVSANKLVGVTAETPIDPEAGYVLLKEDNVLGFYKNTYAFTLGANTAYLPVNFDQNVEARASYLLFDDMTGISQVAGSKVKTNGVIYNLNGQRVSNPTKGIYIIDGVKVAIE